MAWETPSYEDVNMSAEIGGYQDEFEERTPLPTIPAQPARQAEEA
ncbi:MAG TPA: hypothetical protein VFS39_15565 [Nitrospira sp.]|nr:hypothetical protein [Nitrospira sp.]